MAASLPITCAQTIVRASFCVGFTFPGMMDEPGSFAGRWISPIPHLGPEASIRILLPMCIRLTARVFNAPEVSTIASCAESDSNLFSAVTKWITCKFSNLSSHFFGITFGGVLIPVPTAVPPSAKFCQMRQEYFSRLSIHDQVVKHNLKIPAQALVVWHPSGGYDRFSQCL